MKAHISALLCAAILTVTLTACGSVVRPENDRTLQVVATIFPVYDWVRQIVGNSEADIEVTQLLDSRVDMHSYQPTAEDMVKISTCDMFLYLGGESDDWVQEALAGSKNPNRIVINLMDVLGDAVKEEETIEGMQEDEDEAEEGPESDEHIWLSLRNAVTLCRYISGKLV